MKKIIFVTLLFSFVYMSAQPQGNFTKVIDERDEFKKAVEERYFPGLKKLSDLFNQLDEAIDTGDKQMAQELYEKAEKSRKEILAALPGFKLIDGSHKYGHWFKNQEETMKMWNELLKQKKEEIKNMNVAQQAYRSVKAKLQKKQ